VCGACEHDRSRRWTSTRLIVLAFVAFLLVLSLAGVVIRARAGTGQATDSCTAAASAAIRFQSAVTRDIGKPARLRSDTAAFLGEFRALGAAGCQDTRRFLASAERTIGDLCPSCATELRRAHMPAA
jgi:hypothetical protein